MPAITSAKQLKKFSQLSRSGMSADTARAAAVSGSKTVGRSSGAARFFGSFFRSARQMGPF